jgi:hypothetical protein
MSEPPTYLEQIYRRLQNHKLIAVTLLGFTALATVANFSQTAFSLWDMIAGEQVGFQFKFVHRMAGDSTDIKAVVVNDGNAPLYIAGVLLNLDRDGALTGRSLRARDESSAIEPGAAREFNFTVARKELDDWARNSRKAWFTVASNRREVHRSVDIMEDMRSNNFRQVPPDTPSSAIAGAQ